MKMGIEFIDYPTIRSALLPVVLWSTILWIFMFAALAYFAVGRWQKTAGFLLWAAVVLAIVAALPALISLPLGPRAPFPGSLLLIWPLGIICESLWIVKLNATHNRNELERPNKVLDATSL
jgi:hypothetical protein